MQNSKKYKSKLYHLKTHISQIHHTISNRINIKAHQNHHFITFANSIEEFNNKPCQTLILSASLLSPIT